MEILIGCDPEVFVKKVGAKRFHVSAHGMNEGTKENPIPVDGGAIQVDGMALEFNIDPARTEDEFVGNVKKVLQHLRDTLPKGYELSIVPTAHFTKKTFNEAPDEAKELGCNPDYNAWTGNMNNKPNGDVTFRTASGHIHIGWTQGKNPFDHAHYRDCMLVVQALDCVIGAGSLQFDKCHKRRMMYGKAGAFRPKPYGVEYRVLSNAWLLNEGRMRWVYRCVKTVLEELASGELSNPRDFEYRVRSVIDSKLTSQYGLASLRDNFPMPCAEGLLDV